MKKKMEKFVEIPEGFKVEVNGDTLKVSRGSEEISRRFRLGQVEISVVDNKIRVFCNRATRKEAATIGSVCAHIKNMFKGLEEGFEYVLEICHVHFPMNVKVEGDAVVIKSFLGETTARFAKILPGVSVDISGNKITVRSKDIELAGQTAANIEKATRITKKDRRIFQDGIFLIEKPGRKIG